MSFSKLKLWSHCYQARAKDELTAIDQKLIEFNHEHKQFYQEVTDCDSGYLSPKGVFFPCDLAGHEPLRLYLQKLFKLDFPRTPEMGNIDYEVECLKRFEEKWVKFANDNMPSTNKLLFAGSHLTAYQKIFIEAWATQVGFENNPKFKLKQSMDLGENYHLDFNLRIRLKSKNRIV